MKLPAPIRRALIGLAKRYVAPTQLPRSGRWHPLVERFPGYWQRHVEASRDDILSLPTAFAAQGLIAQDFAKLTWRLQRFDNATGVWVRASIEEIDSLIVRPNSFQHRLQFAESWMQSKLSNGNTYALKSRLKGRVAALHILDPWRTRPLVSPGGSVFYELAPDSLSGVSNTVIVPASEIIHDRFNTLYHPLVGVSPLHAASLTATLGIEIQARAARFWKNNAQPSGAIVIPGEVDEEEVARLKENWNAGYGDDNFGKTAVLAGGMDYKPFSDNARDSQLVEQLKLTREEIATAYRLPFYKVGAGDAPSVSNTGQLDQEYYSQCLQTHIVNFELSMTLGLELPTNYRLDLDEGDILRMDPLTKAQVVKERLVGGWWTRNEARREDNLAPKPGGDDLLVQEQYWPASAVSDPSRGVPAKGVSQSAPPANDDDADAMRDDEKSADRLVAAFEKALAV